MLAAAVNTQVHTPELIPQPGWLKRAVLAALALSPPAVAYLVGFSICPVVIMADQPCPGCGLTRASVALAQGDWSGALSLNPSAPIVVPILVGVMAWGAFTYVRYARIHIPRKLGLSVLFAAIVLNVIWVARLFGAFGGMVSV